MADKYRLVTRSDFDGLVCAVLLKEMSLIDEIKFVHPKDVQDGLVEITENDITTNLPYCPNVHLSFDHHLSEILRNADIQKENCIIKPEAPSAARVVYDYYGGKERFPAISEEMIAAVDAADSAQYTMEEVLNPEKWMLLNTIMDPRTGLGRFRDFRISNYQLMMELISYCRSKTIDEILELPDVVERTELYFSHKEKAEQQLKECTTVYGSLAVLDLREADPIWCTNRFTIYALFPEINMSIHVLWGLKKQNTVFAVGKSILNKTSSVNIGDIMLGYGGGGHMNAGTCQIETDKAENVLKELISKLSE
ncbi:MAG: exopolyphosphatase [Deltaproteobacteria bacterium]|nr:MAG: exopolyphosphatase [Deltaproteobacteria bacterium]